MTWGAVAVAGATVVSGAMGAKSADKASERADDAAKKQLAFEQQRYDDWNATYGPIQDNLANYYSTLTPEYFETQNLEAYQQEHQDAVERIREDFAQRGISDSGLAADFEKEAEFERAQTRATIRAAAPGQAAEEKRQFLQVGLGQNPGQSVSSSMAQRASELSATSRQAQIAAGQGAQSAIQAVGTGIDAYINRPNDWTTPDVAPPAPNAGAVSAIYPTDNRGAV